MADDFDHQCANNIADEPYVPHCAAGSNERCGDRQKGIAGAHCIDHFIGKWRYGVNPIMSLAGDASILAMGDDDIWAVNFGFDNAMSDVAEFRDTVSQGKSE